MNTKMHEQQVKALVRSLRALRDERRASTWESAGAAAGAPSAEALAQARDTLARMTGLQVVEILLAYPGFAADHLDPR